MGITLAPFVVLLLVVGGSLAAKQSPINIIKKDAVTTALPDLEFTNYDNDNVQGQYLIDKVGKLAKITLPRSTNTTLMTGGPLSDEKYQLDHIRFHWGKDEFHGSEHQIDGEPFSMEAHLIHYNNKYSSFHEASSQPDGLAVVGILLYDPHMQYFFNYDFQDVDSDMKRAIWNNQFNTPWNEALTFSDSDLLAWALPALQPSRYYTYQGSLTTEPYSENVIWIVYEDSINVSGDQIDVFRSYDENPTENIRAIQPLDGRVVKYVS